MKYVGGLSGDGMLSFDARMLVVVLLLYDSPFGARIEFEEKTTSLFAALVNAT